MVYFKQLLAKTVLFWFAISAILCQIVSSGASEQTQDQVGTLSQSQCAFCLTEFDQHDSNFLNFKTCNHGSCKKCLADWFQVLTRKNHFDNEWLKCAFCRNQLSEHDLVSIAQEMIENNSFNVSVALHSILKYANSQGYNYLATVILNHFQTLPREQSLAIEQAVNKARLERARKEIRDVLMNLYLHWLLASEIPSPARPQTPQPQRQAAVPFSAYQDTPRRRTPPALNRNQFS